jgi:hypothetical protein
MGYHILTWSILAVVTGMARPADCHYGPVLVEDDLLTVARFITDGLNVMQYVCLHLCWKNVFFDLE